MSERTLIEEFAIKARDHVHLAVIAEAVPVAEMHLDLALFSGEQVRTIKALHVDA